MLDTDSVIPDWIPKQLLWYNFNRFGIDGISASIENKLQTMGVDTREPSLEEKATGLNRQLVGARTRKEFLESQKAIPIAHSEANLVYKRFTEAAEEIGKNNAELRGELTREPEGMVIKLRGFRLFVGWRIYYMNSLQNSALHVWLSEIDRNHFNWDPKYRYIRQDEFDFSMSLSDEYGWRNRTSRDRFYSSKEVAELAVNLLIDQVASYRFNELKP